MAKTPDHQIKGLSTALGFQAPTAASGLVWAPAAFRKHGVYLSARDLEAA